MVLNLLCGSFCVFTSYILDILSAIFFCSLSSFLFCFSSFFSLLFSASRFFLFGMFLFYFLSFFPGGSCFPLLYFFNPSIFSLLSCIVFVMVFIFLSSFLIFLNHRCVRFLWCGICRVDDLYIFFLLFRDMVDNHQLSVLF